MAPTATESVGPDDDAFLGACCMQLVEMVIPMRRAGKPDPDIARSIGLACLRVVGANKAAIATATGRPARTAARAQVDAP